MPASQSVSDFFISVLQDDKLREQFTEALGKEDTPTLLRLAEVRGYDFTANELRQGLSIFMTFCPVPSRLII